MALKKCKECGKEVSTKAEKCPHCGLPVKNEKNPEEAFVLLIGFLFIILILVTGRNETPPQPAPPVRTEPQVQPPREVVRKPRDGTKQARKAPNDARRQDQGGKLSSQQKVPRSVAQSHTANSGRAIFERITRKYPGVKPLAWGLGTATPKAALFIPEKEWNMLPRTDQLNLALYAKSLVPVFRSEPDKYVAIPAGAPIYNVFRARLTSLCDDCWAVGIGPLTRDKKGAQLDRIVVQGDSVWEKSDPCCRGVKFSEFRNPRVQKGVLSKTSSEKPVGRPQPTTAGSKVRQQLERGRIRIVEGSLRNQPQLNSVVLEEMRKIYDYITVDELHLEMQPSLNFHIVADIAGFLSRGTDLDKFVKARCHSKDRRLIQAQGKSSVCVDLSGCQTIHAWIVDPHPDSYIPVMITALTHCNGISLPSGKSEAIARRVTPMALDLRRTLLK